MGSLIEAGRDASGQMYRRNRYYDPATGRFTQEDPIGLAGGLNLYGFAGGDPVTFSDPFGLCKKPPCFRVWGSATCIANWNALVAQSPYLRDLIAQAGKATSPEFNLVEVGFSIDEATQARASGGLTQVFDAGGSQFSPRDEPDTPIDKINAFVSAADVIDPQLQAWFLSQGRVLNLSNVQVHEFGHGILFIQGYKPKTRAQSERQAQLVECKVAGETGGSCKP